MEPSKLAFEMVFTDDIFLCPFLFNLHMLYLTSFLIFFEYISAQYLKPLNTRICSENTKKITSNRAYANWTKMDIKDIIIGNYLKR